MNFGGLNFVSINSNRNYEMVLFNWARPTVEDGPAG
jgi:hypothetical protein